MKQAAFLRKWLPWLKCSREASGDQHISLIWLYLSHNRHVIKQITSGEGLAMTKGSKAVRHLVKCCQSNYKFHTFIRNITHSRSLLFGSYSPTVLITFADILHITYATMGIVWLLFTIIVSLPMIVGKCVHTKLANKCHRLVHAACNEKLSKERANQQFQWYILCMLCLCWYYVLYTYSCIIR